MKEKKQMNVVEIIIETLIVLLLCTGIGFATYKHLDYNDGKSKENLVEIDRSVNQNSINIENSAE